MNPIGKVLTLHVDTSGLMMQMALTSKAIEQLSEAMGCSMLGAMGLFIECDICNLLIARTEIYNLSGMRLCRQCYVREIAP